MLALLETYPVLVPFCIFLLRVVDVSIGTLKLLFVVRGYRTISSVLAFIEISIWLCATALVFNYLGNFWNALAFAGGFAAGTAVGMTIERSIRVGHVLVRVFSKCPAEQLRPLLRENGYGGMFFQGTGNDGDHTVVLVLAPSKMSNRLTRLIREQDPEAIMTVDSVKGVFGGMGLPRPLVGTLRK